MVTILSPDRGFLDKIADLTLQAPQASMLLDWSAVGGRRIFHIFGHFYSVGGFAARILRLRFGRASEAIDVGGNYRWKRVSDGVLNQSAGLVTEIDVSASPLPPLNDSDNCYVTLTMSQTINAGVAGTGEDRVPLITGFSSDRRTAQNPGGSAIWATHVMNVAGQFDDKCEFFWSDGSNFAAKSYAYVLSGPDGLP